MNAWRQRSGEKGMSLIELMVVCIIIGILLSIANAQYQSFYQGLAVKGFATAILVKARAAKNLSRSLSEEATLAIDLDNESVWIEVDGVQHGTVLAPALHTVEIKGFHDPDAAGTFVTTGVQRLIFSTEGTMKLGSLHSINGAVMHVGLKSNDYAVVGAESDDFKSLWFIAVTGSPMLFQTGCVNSAAWEAYHTPNWPNCDAL